MANPDFRSEAGGDQNGTASATISFTGLTWQANDIICVFVATDGYVPTLSTANGFAIAVDSNGNAASVTTNAGVGGTAECGMFVFWKRAVGANTTSDPEPVIAAPTGGGTTWCLETNAYLGARTTGTPWHIITTAIVSSATTTVAPPSVTPTLNAVLVMPCAASSTDDQAFNAWTLSGAASPAGQIDAGWHSGSSNQCAFTTGRGGYATTGGARSGSTTFSASTKQAQITLVMASLNEALVGDEDAAARSGRLPLAALLSAAAPPADELPAQSSGPVDEDGVPAPWVLPVPVIRYAATSDDEAPSTVAASIIDEDGTPQPARPPVLPLPLGTPSPDDETSIPAAVVDDDVPVPLPVRPLLPPPAPAPPPDDEFPGGSLPAGVDEEARVWSGPPAAPSLPVVAPAVADELIAAVTSGIGGASDAQRSFLAPPQTGTLSTTAPLPAWTTSHAYAIDPTQGAINRVQNGGNHYQCTQDGTSASSGGGPSGTGTAISDGSTVWRYIGPVQVTNTAAGSQILCTVMRGNESQAATVAPTDNDGGGTYTLITDNQYASFAGSFAGVWRRPTASNAKTNFQTSGVWGGSGGAGDEMSIGWIELQGVSVGAPHASSHVERANSSGGTVTAAAITTTVPCIIISYWFGNGTVQTAGQPDAATPAGGLTLIAGSTGELSLTTAGYVQHMVAWRKQSTPGTFSEVWTASPTDQGAQLVTIAYQDLSAPAGISVDDDTPSQRARVVATPAPLRSVAMPEDELSPAADAGADDDVTRLGVLWVAPVLSAGGGADDEVAGQAVVDDDGAPVMAVPAVAARLAGAPPDTEELPTIALEEWGQVMAVPIVAVPVAGAVTSDDEITGGAPVDEDNAQVIAIPVVVPPPLLTLLSDDELASGGGVSLIEEDATITTVPTVVRPQLVTPPSIDEVATASGASAIEDEQPVQVGVRPVERAMSVRAGEDELISGAVVVDEDQGAVLPVVAVAAVPLARSVDEDALAPPSLEDDAPAVQAVAWAPLPAVLWVAADDDLPLAALVDDAGAMIALTWTSPLVGQAAPGDDDLPPGDVAAVIVDEDQLLAPLVWQVPALLSGPVVADELPRPKKPKPTPTGTSLLDGFIAQQVASALGAAKMLKPATLIKVTPGVRTPGLISGGTNPTLKSYKAKGIEQNLLSLQLAGTLIAGVDAAIRLFGATIEGGQVPVAGDRIVIGGKTYTIVAGGVSRDPASVSYLAQCKL